MKTTLFIIGIVFLINVLYARARGKFSCWFCRAWVIVYLINPIFTIFRQDSSVGTHFSKRSLRLLTQKGVNMAMSLI